jgi:hypothetical protein
LGKKDQLANREWPTTSYWKRRPRGQQKSSG